jgi:hypothetical protein
MSYIAGDNDYWLKYSDDIPTGLMAYLKAGLKNGFTTTLRVLSRAAYLPVRSRGQFRNVSFKAGMDFYVQGVEPGVKTPELIVARHDSTTAVLTPGHIFNHMEVWVDGADRDIPLDSIQEERRKSAEKIINPMASSTSLAALVKKRAKEAAFYL